MKSFQNLSKLIVLAFVLSAFAFGCKSAKKTAATNAAAEKAKMEQEANLRKQKEGKRKAAGGIHPQDDERKCP